MVGRPARGRGCSPSRRPTARKIRFARRTGLPCKADAALGLGSTNPGPFGALVADRVPGPDFAKTTSTHRRSPSSAMMVRGWPCTPSSASLHGAQQASGDRAYHGAFPAESLAAHWLAGRDPVMLGARASAGTGRNRQQAAAFFRFGGPTCGDRVPTRPGCKNARGAGRALSLGRLDQGQMSKEVVIRRGSWDRYRRLTRAPAR